MEAMMNSGTLVPPATAPTSTRSSRRNAAPAPAVAGAEEEDKEKRKAEKKRLKEEKKLEKAMLKARMGLQGAAGEDGNDDEGEGQGDGEEVPESTTGGSIGVGVIADELSASSSKKRKADAAAELPGQSAPEAEAEAETASEPAGKKSKGKKGKGKATDVGAASASMDDEKLQELANAVLGGSLPITADAGASGIEVRPAYGLSGASNNNNDNLTGMDDAQLDIAQRVAGIDDSAIDPALQQLQAIEEADMDAATLWNATRRAMKTAEEGAASASASDRARGKANGKGRDAMLVDADAALDDDHAGDHDFLMDGNDESNDPFGHAQAQGGITGLINATLMQQQQQEQEQEDQLGPQQQYGQDSSSFEYALPADAQAHTFGGMSGTVGTSAPTGTAPKSAAVPRKRRKAGDPPARKGRPPNPVGPDGEPLPLGTAGDGAEAGDCTAAGGSGSGGAAGDQTGFAAPKKQTRVVNTAKGPKDDELVALFQTPGEMERFLAERWLPSQELIRLEHAGILAYKKGKFSVEESEAIAAFAEEFKRLHRIDAHKFADIVVSLGKKPDYPRFWNDIALVVPGRPVRFVQKYVKRVFDPRARQGPWQQDEDKALEQACFANPGQWTKIAAAVGRTEDDCRTRWRDELRHKAERERGRWTKEEEQRLSDIIVRHNLELGKEAHARDAPWESVVKEMGGSRTTMQCRKKWHDQLMPALKKAGGKYILKKKDRPRLIEAISGKKYAREEHVDFQEIAREEFGMDDYHPLRAMYRRIRAKVPDADEPGLVYSALVARMAEALALNVTASSFNYKSAATVEHVSDDEAEEDDGEGEGEGAANGGGNGSGSGPGSGTAGSHEGSYSRPTLDTVADAVAAAAAASGGEGGEGEGAGEQGAIA